MANRVVIQADIDNYASAFVGFHTPMQLGDIIINTRTNTTGDGKGAYFCITAASTFSGARSGAVIWIDGASLGTLYDFRLNNASSGTEWMIAHTDRVWIRPIPGTQVRVWRNTSTNNGYTMLIQDMKHWGIDGENDAYPGMRDGVGRSVFLRGTFGIWLSGDKDLNSSHMLSTDCIDGGSMIWKGIEIEHGFSASRTLGGNDYRTGSPFLDRSYLHDGISGEGCYWGGTHAIPVSTLKGPIIRNCIIVRRAAETVQIQHLINNPSAPARIHNNVLKDGATDYVNAFQPYQDSGIQASIDGGTNIIENNICDATAASNTYVTYGGSVVPYDGLNTSLRNNLFTKGGGIFHYINNSCVQGNKWIIQNNIIRNFTGLYYEDSGELIQNYAVGQNNGTDKFVYIGNQFDSSKSSIFQNSSGFDLLNNTINDINPEPEYVLSGFLPEERPVKWAEFWGDYHPNPNGTAYTVYIDRIYINAVDGVEYRFYKALTTHTASAARRPDLYPTGFEALTWDESGVRSDWIGWSSGDIQSDYPPDDLRLVSNNLYNQMGIGLLDNEPNTNHTRYQWYRANDTSGTNTVAIPGGRSLKYTPELCDKGKYVRLGVKPKNATTYGTETFSNWKLVS